MPEPASEPETAEVIVRTRPHANSRPGNVAAVNSGAFSTAAKRSRRLAEGGARAAVVVKAVTPDALTRDWSKIVATTPQAFTMRITRLAQSLAREEGISYVGLRAMDPVGRLTLIALAGLTNSAESRTYYATELALAGDRHSFDQFYLLARDVQCCHRLRKLAIQALHDAVPLTAKGGRI